MTGGNMKKIQIYEPWFFFLFGLFHLHRIWGLFDREAYADFWLEVMTEKGVIYYSLMGVLALLCILGIITFWRNRRQNYWWRWIYLFGGGYVLFDLFAIAAGVRFWHELLLKMFDTSASYWNLLWSAFILMGGASLTLSILLFIKQHKQARKN